MNTFRHTFATATLTASMALTFASAMYAAPVRRSSAPYTFDVPEGWTSTAVGADGTVVANGGAYVRIVKVPGAAKDEKLINRVIDQISKQWMRFKFDSRGQQKLDGNQGIYLMISGVNPKGIEATMRIDATPFGDDAYMLIMSAPSTDFFGFQAAFQKIENSFAMTSGSSRPAASDESPAPPTGSGPKVVDAAGGGHLLLGPLTGVESGTAAFKAALRHTRGMFDASIKLLGVVRGKDNPNLTMGSFSGVKGGGSIGGLVVSVYDPEGGSRFAVMYDAPDHLAKSLPAMFKRFDSATQEQLESTRPQARNAAMDFARFEQASKHVSLSRVEFQDNTASIGVATGFKPIQMSGGRFTATAADGAYMTLFRPCNVLDPRGTLYQSQIQLGRNIHSGPMRIPGQVILEYDADPVSAWKKYLVANARQNSTINPDPQVLKREAVAGKNNGFRMVNISGTMTVNGEPYVFTGCLIGSPPPPATGGWSVQATILQAPVAHASTDMPAMIAMQQSEKVDMQAVHEQTMQYIATINSQTTAWLRANKAAYDEASQRRFDSAMANARATRDATDRSTAGFIHYINGTSVLQHNPTGAHGTVDTNLAKALEQADPQHLSVVSAKDYIKGVDY